MNILPFLHFFAFLVYIYLLLFVLWRNPKSSINRACAAFLACFIVWSFGFIFVHNPEVSKDSVSHFMNIASIGWSSFGSLFLWFSLIFVKKKKVLKQKIFYLPLFILPLLFIYKQWTGFLIVDYSRQSYGWASIWSQSIWPYLFYVYYLSFVVAGLYLVFNFRKKTEKPNEKKQAVIIFVTTLIPLVFGSLVSVVFPRLNIYEMPSVSNLIVLIWAGGLVYAVARYEFMIMTPAMAADNIISTMTDSLILLSPSAKIMAVNQYTLDLLGYKKSELIDQPVDIIFTGKSPFKGYEIEKLMEKYPIRDYEMTYKTKSGQGIPISFSGSVMRNKEGELIGIIGIARDITQRKKAEEALRESENRFRQVAESAGEWIWEVDEKGLYTYASPVLEKILGYKPEEVVGKKHFYDLLRPQEREKLKKKTFEIFAKKQSFYRFINQNVHKDGRTVWLSTSGVPIVDDEGKLLGYRGADTDITELKQAEEKERELTRAAEAATETERERVIELIGAYRKLERTRDMLIQAGKMAAVGQLASGVAHEVKNPLAIIIQGVSYLEKKLSPEQKDVFKILNIVKESVGRADNIIKSILDFSKVTELALKPENINSILENSLNLVKQGGKVESIEVIREMKQDIPMVLIDKNKMEQVFVNLFLNAAQAMPQGGKLIIRSYETQLENARRGIGRRGEDYFSTGEGVVMVEIEDTGIGISKETLGQIFDPFFTTKGPGGGTGLGLSVTRNIIDMHKSLIDVQSQVDKGTKVSITLKIAK